MKSKQTIILVLLGLSFLSSAFANTLCDDNRCKSCTEGAAYCDICLDGYTVVESACGRCAEGYAKVSLNNNRCVKCSDSNCSSCPENYATCLKCADQFELIEGKCKDIQPKTAFTDVEGCEYSKEQMGCARCNTNRILSKDEAGKPICQCDSSQGFIYKLTGNIKQCVPCTATNCVKCSLNSSGAEICDQCEQGYVADKSLMKCSACAVGYGFQKGSYVCKPCSASCLECSATDRNTCTKCAEGSTLINGQCQRNCDAGAGFLDGAGECTACDDTGCGDCGANNYTCNQCKDGFIFFQEKCTKCEFQNCHTCSTGETGLFCKICQIGFQKESQQLDALCIASTVQCEAGKGLTIDNVCAPCVKENCASCSKNNSLCETCQEGFMLERQICIQQSCPIGTGKDLTNNSCQKCLDASCTDCKENFQKCTTCRDGLTVSNEGKCVSSSTTCPEGQGVNILEKKCDVCKDINCANCLENHLKCASCKSGFNKSADEVCVQVETTTCQDGQGLNADKKCTICKDTNCAKCGANFEVCEACKTDFKKDDLGACIQSETPTCQEGQGLNPDNRCITCKDTFCAKCGANFERCESCKTGYQPNALGICEKTCPIEGCLKCNDDGASCITCISELFFHQGQCLKLCPAMFGPTVDQVCAKCQTANCANCQQSLKQCSACTTGYLLQGGVCKQSTAPVCTITNCAECDSLGVCKTCVAGTFLGKVNGKQVCYKRAASNDETKIVPDGCSNLIANCATCSVSANQEILCDSCVVGEKQCGDSGDFYLKKSDTFSACVRKFELEECKMEGCLKCHSRRSLDTTCPAGQPVCTYAADGYMIVQHNGNKIAVLKDLTKYDNINYKSPIANCKSLSTQADSLASDLMNLVCKECVQRHQLDRETGKCRLSDCFAKVANCLNCTNEKGCIECGFGFELTSTGTCQESKLDCSVIEGCTICKKNPDMNNALICGACSDGFRLKENKCEKCGELCQPTITCAANCGTCKDTKECITCAAGLLKAPFCNVCQKNDQVFDEERLVCKARCLHPQVFDREKQLCIKPSLPNCLRFQQVGTAISCNQCVRGYGLSYVNNVASCKECTKGCVECKFDGTTEYCGTCAEGWTFNSSNKCALVSTDGTTPVTECSVSKETSLTNCLQCYYKDSKPICAACQDQFKLTNNGTCAQSCEAGQYLSADNTCQSCEKFNCARGCYQSATTSRTAAARVICIENLCADGFYFDKEQLSCLEKQKDLNCSDKQYVEKDACHECPKGCSGCTSAFKCTGCIDGFQYDQNSAQCFVKREISEIKPAKCLENCAQCETQKFCLECAKGFVLGENKASCVTEQVNCSTGLFLQGNNCISCKQARENCEECVAKEGQFFCTKFVEKKDCAENQMRIQTENGLQCVEDKLCSTFDKENNCLKCRNGSEPVPIDANKPDSRKTCRTCANANSEGVCITCPKFCDKCSEGAGKVITCDACQPRFELKEGKCSEKAIECAESLIRNPKTNRCECPYLSKQNAAGICECITGLVWNTNKQEGCRKPEANDCQTGFRPDAEGQCIACTSRILTFKEDGKTEEDYSPRFCAACSGETCDRCKPGSFLIKEKNVCHQCEPGCAICTGFGQCQRCEAGKLLNSGVCKDTCDIGTLPSLKSYWMSNDDLHKDLDKTQRYAQMTLKPDTTISTLEKCGEPLAINEHTFCSQDTSFKLPFQVSPVPKDINTGAPVTLECLPCKRLCKACVAGLILDPNGGQCTRQCPLGFKPQKNDSTGQLTCAAEVVEQTDVVKLETRVHLESRLAEQLRGLSVQNTFQRARLYVKNTLPEENLQHSLKLENLFLLGSGKEKEQVQQKELKQAEAATFGEVSATIANSVKTDGQTLFIPANTLKPNYIYKFTVVSVKYNADKKIEQEAVSTILVAAVQRDTYEQLDATVAEASVANEKLFSLEKQCASLTIKDLVNYSKSDQFLVSISYRRAYIDSRDTMEPNQVTESSYENVFCFNAPYVEKETNYQVNFKLSFNGVHRTIERFFVVLPSKTNIDADLEAQLQEAKDVTATENETATKEKSLPKTQFIDLVSIITGKTEGKLGTEPTEIKPTDNATTTTKPNEKLCVATGTDAEKQSSCNNKGTCEVVNRVPVCKCDEEGYSSVDNCLQQWDTAKTAEIKKANEQLLTVLEAANKQASAKDVKPENRLTDSVKAEIASKILSIPIQEPEVAKQAVKLLKTLTSSADMPVKKVVQALSTAARTIQKLTRTTKKAGRFLTEEELNQADLQVDNDSEQTIKKVLERMEIDLPEENDVEEVNTEAFNLKVARVQPTTDPKVTQVQQQIAARGDNGQPIVATLPKSIFKDKKNPQVRTFTQDRLSAILTDDFIPARTFEFAVSEDDVETTGRRILRPIDVENLETPIEFHMDVSKLQLNTKPVQCRYLNRSTNKYETKGVKFNKDTSSCESTHNSYFAIGNGDVEITTNDGSESQTSAVTDSNASPTPINNNPSTKPEAIGVNSNILSTIIAIIATISAFCLMF